MPCSYSLVSFFFGFCIPAYHSLVALKTQSQYLIRIWLVYFLTVVFYELILSFVFDHIIGMIDSRLLFLKTIFVLLYIFPETGFQESYLNFFNNYQSKLHTIFLDKTKQIVSPSIDLPEETSLSSSPTPSIPEEGDIKAITSLKEPVSEDTTLAPNTPVGKLNADFTS
ncbi:hypothetical protein OJ253_1797 [Cryptosporidium canis]|uniref:Uncharacterized protein n=1 Tax=Cryptosporidium canis TaxID=195482 RepID=A0A9D5HXL0_9CRYT|nr:hypothetical protein OJ253_1797 [Cryptosporidium canis]